MRKFKIMVVAMLSIAFVLGTAIPSQAASTDVMIEVKETGMDNVSVTVPTTLPVVFNEDGTNTYPTNFEIVNTSPIAGIHLARVELDAGESGWYLVDTAEDTKELPLDTKGIQFAVGINDSLKFVEPLGGTGDVGGLANFNADEISIASGDSQVLNFRVNRGAFSSSQASAKAFHMVLGFEFN